MDGATVVVDSVAVIGNVSPSQAAVHINGRHVPVANGMFKQVVRLRRGVNRFRITAVAAGYAETATMLSVRYAGPPRGIAESRAGSDFFTRVGRVCQGTNAKITALPRLRTVTDIIDTAAKVEPILARFIAELQSISPPRALASQYSSFIKDQQDGLDLLRQAVGDLRTNNREAARQAVIQSLRVGEQSDSLALGLGVPTCAVTPVPSGG